MTEMKSRLTELTETLETLINVSRNPSLVIYTNKK